MFLLISLLVSFFNPYQLYFRVLVWVPVKNQSKFLFPVYSTSFSIPCPVFYFISFSIFSPIFPIFSILFPSSFWISFCFSPFLYTQFLPHFLINFFLAFFQDFIFFSHNLFSYWIPSRIFFFFTVIYFSIYVLFSVPILSRFSKIFIIMFFPIITLVFFLSLFCFPFSFIFFPFYFAPLLPSSLSSLPILFAFHRFPCFFVCVSYYFSLVFQGRFPLLFPSFHFLFLIQVFRGSFYWLLFSSFWHLLLNFPVCSLFPFTLLFSSCFLFGFFNGSNQHDQPLIHQDYHRSVLGFTLFPPPLSVSFIPRFLLGLPSTSHL